MEKRDGGDIVQGMMCENEGAGKLLPTFLGVHVLHCEIRKKFSGPCMAGPACLV